MVARFTSDRQAALFTAVRSKLRSIGYRNGLLERDYHFSDWFLPDEPTRIAPLAAFGQTPPSTDTACFAVIPTRDVRGLLLIEQYRALGAPYAFEITDDSVVHWIVGKDRQSTKQAGQYSADQLDAAFASHFDEWQPAAILRAKNISYSTAPTQLELFDYELLPELESRIREKLDPVVQRTCAAARKAYREIAGRDPDMRQLFKLAFWMLAGKVFHDRGLDKFQQLSGSSSAEDILEKVAEHYDEPMPRLLNQHAREAVQGEMWSRFNFRNLSIDVLTQVWAHVFVSEDIRQELGIHATPRPIAKFVVDNLPFKELIDGRGLIVEPCSGSGTFLVAALQRLRDLLPSEMTSGERHTLFKRRLFGFEKESIGVEISRLCLTLADYPNPNGWQLNERDVFASRDFSDSLQQARVVLCNPPFEDFSPTERKKYEPASVKKPLELLNRVLSGLHPEGMIGFVMPRLVVDGDGYAPLRESLASRFAEIHVLALPDKAFQTADAETALILAHGRKQATDKSTVGYAKVKEDDWGIFRAHQQTSFFASEQKSPAQARIRLSVQPLQAVWRSLRNYTSLGDIAHLARGIEWTDTLPLTKKGKETGNRDILVKSRPQRGYRLGLPPRAKFLSFVPERLAYLSMLPGHKREGSNSFDQPWADPKIIMNKSTKSRGEWRVAAFADRNGLVFYQTFIGIWPTDSRLTVPISAVLNGPVANAYISTIEGKIDITIDTLRQIPIPKFSDAAIVDLELLTEQYVEAIKSEPMVRASDFIEADRLLRRIDAVVLQAYDLSARCERELLDFFGDTRRQVPFLFRRYFPVNFEPYVPLGEYLSEEYAQADAARFIERFRKPPNHVLQGLEKAAKLFGNEE